MAESEQPEKIVNTEPLDEDIPSSDEEDWNLGKGGADGDDAGAEPKVKEIDYSALEGDEKELAGEVVPIQLNLPNGDKPVRNYVMGQTIAYVKGHLEDIYGLAYHTTTLKMNGKELIDPLSLNDIPSFKANEINVVEVTVE